MMPTQSQLALLADFPLDVVTARADGSQGDGLAWYENAGGMGGFGGAHPLSTRGGR